MHIEIILGCTRLSQSGHVAIGTYHFAKRVKRDVECQILLLFVADDATAIAHKPSLVERLPAAVRDVTEDAGNAGRMTAQPPVQVFLVMQSRRTVGPEGTGLRGADERFIQGQGPAWPVVDGKLVLSGGIVTARMTLSADLGLLLKREQRRVDDAGPVAGQSHVLQTRAVACLALDAVVHPLAGGGFKAGRVTTSTVV